MNINMCMYSYMHIYTYVCIHVPICMYTHMYVYMCVCIHTHAQYSDLLTYIPEWQVGINPSRAGPVCVHIYTNIYAMFRNTDMYSRICRWVQIAVRRLLYLLTNLARIQGRVYHHPSALQAKVASTRSQGRSRVRSRI